MIYFCGHRNPTETFIASFDEIIKLRTINIGPGKEILFGINVHQNN